MHTYGWFVVSVDLESFILDVFTLDRFNNNGYLLDITVYSICMVLVHLDVTVTLNWSFTEVQWLFTTMIFYGVGHHIFKSQIQKSYPLLTQL